MSLLTLAIHTNRWDLAACAIVLATLQRTIDGEKIDAGKQDSLPKAKNVSISPA